jgi:hypothetical protein
MSTPAPAPQPAHGGSYTRDPATGALLLQSATAPTAQQPQADPLQKAEARAEAQAVAGVVASAAAAAPKQAAAPAPAPSTQNKG